jgi:hypothetical protein
MRRSQRCSDVAGALAAACTGGGSNADHRRHTVLGGPPSAHSARSAPGFDGHLGISFKGSPLDAGGPITVEAVKGGDVDVGLLTSDHRRQRIRPARDDKHLQLADNTVPVAPGGPTLAWPIS